MIIRIREPWWGAFKEFGWPKGTWGVGLDAKKVERAIEKGENLCISIGNLGIYHGDPKLIKLMGHTHKAKGKKLYVASSEVLEKKN